MISAAGVHATGAEAEALGVTPACCVQGIEAGLLLFFAVDSCAAISAWPSTADAAAAKEPDIVNGADISADAGVSWLIALRFAVCLVTSSDAVVDATPASLRVVFGEQCSAGSNELLGSGA